MSSYQPPILSCLRDSLPRLNDVLKRHSSSGRTDLARQVCKEFKFITAKGNFQTSSCLSALVTLDQETKIALPPTESRSGRPNARLLGDPVPPPHNVPNRIESIKGLRIELVKTRRDLALWNTLIAHEHPLGITKFAGHQKKYLFASDHGYLGAIGFAASAPKLESREAWIGWSDQQRRAHLSHVMGLCRFLIRPGVACKNLASYLLARCLRHMSMDMYQDHQIYIWAVETFVDPSYSGSCFHAAGFHRIGYTKGRGRYAPTGATPRSKKAIWWYEFPIHWRQQLGVSAAPVYPILEIGAGLDGDHWAAQEFGAADFGYKSLTKRLVLIARLVSRSPGEPITANIEMDLAAVTGYYRFIDHPNTESITPERILAPHRDQTVKRIRGQKIALCLIDETKITYNTRPSCDGLEVIGRNQTSSEAEGGRLHATLAVTDEGLPIGVLRCGYTPSNPMGQHPDRQRWEDAVDDVIECAREIRRSTKMVVIIDREGDSASLMGRCLRSQRVDVLVRAKHNRNLPDGKKLFKTLRDMAPAGQIEFSVQRLSRQVKSGRVVHEGRDGKESLMEIRYGLVDLPCGSMTAIQIGEMDQDSNALEWFLLTSLPVHTLKDAKEIVKYYLLRWRIEDLFRILKNGCKVEDLRLRSAVQLHRAVTIHMVIAWRLMLLTFLRRTVPNASPEMMFTESQIRALQLFAEHYEFPEPEDLQSATFLVALMGGYQHRKNRLPGVEVMWRGYKRLEIGAEFGDRERSKAGEYPRNEDT